MRNIHLSKVFVLTTGFIAIAWVLMLASCERWSPGAPVTFTTPYQAVMLNTGQGFFGKLEGMGTPYPVLTDVYYIQMQANQDTKQTTSIFVKRGKEAHGPDRMILNAQHILFIEPVATDSQVAKLIEEEKKKK